MPEDSALLDAAITRATRRLIPFTVLMFVLSFLDRVNVGFAKQGMQAGAGISDSAFAMGLGLFFVGYALFETPSNLAMYRVGARRWMARIMVTWGLVSAATLFVSGAPLFYTLRFLLGVAEAGFFPGIALYLTLWFPERARARAMGYFYFGLSLAFVLGGPLSGALLDLDGLAGLRGWQWMFLVEGLAATFVGVAAYAYLSDGPADAPWLPAGERRALEAALAREEADKGHGTAKPWWGVLLDPRLLYCAAIFLISQIALYGVTFYLPMQISNLLGRGLGIAVGVVSAIPWLCALAACAIVPRWSDRTGERRFTGAGLTAVGALGILLATGALGAWTGFAGLCLATAGIVALQPIYFIFPTAYLGGRDAAAGLGIITSIGALGGFVAPNLRVWAEQHYGPAAGLAVIGALTAANALLILGLPLVGLDRGRKPKPDADPAVPRPIAPEIEAGTG